MSKKRIRGHTIIDHLTAQLPSTLTATLTGDTTGTHTGAVVGDVTGDTAGTHTGAVTGDTTGAHNGIVKLPTQVMSANGAITIKSGIAVVTKAGVCAMTLAAPTATTDDGKILYVDSATANAHTLTVTGGLRGAGAGADVGTFGGAIGDGVALYAYQGAWYVLPGSNVNVTFA